MTTANPCRLAAAALAVLLMAAPAAITPALAQTTQPSTSQVDPDRFSDTELKSFAAASIEVEDLHEKWSPQIADAAEPREQADVRAQAMLEMTKAVQATGLSVQEYNQIVQAMQIDPDTARTIEEYRSELR